MAMEVEVDRASGAIRVRRVACAHDCGLVINPDALQRADRRQHPADAVAHAVRGGRVRPLARDERRLGELSDPAFPDVPEIVIDLVDRPQEPPLGAGEAAATPVPAALANAVFDAAGVRLRTVPFTRQRVLAALA